MKKTFLGLIALSLMISKANISGDVELDGKISLDFSNIKPEKKDMLGLSKINLFINENKDIHLFSTLSTKRHEIEKNEVKDLFSVGVSVDSKLNENFEFGFLGYKKFLSKEEFLKNDYVKHLIVKNKYTEDMNDFAKKDALNRNGFISDKDKTEVFSFNIGSKINRTNIYFSTATAFENMKTNTMNLKTYFETDSMLQEGFLNSKLEYEYITDAIEAKKYGFKKTDKVKLSDNLGALKGNIKFSSSRVIPNTFMYTEGKFDLRSGILAKNEERVAVANINNYFKYTGIENLSLITRAQYEMKYVNEKNKKNVLEASAKNTIRLTFESDYDTKDYKIASLFKVDPSLTIKEDFKASTATGLEINNKFEYKKINDLNLHIDANYKLYVGFDTTQDIVTGLGFNYKGRKGRLVYDLNNDARYRLLGFKKFGNYTQNLFVINENSLSYLLRNVKLEGNLNHYSELSFMKNTVEDKKKNKTTVTKNNEYLSFVNLGAKWSYKTPKLLISQDLQGYYNYDSYETNKHRFAVINKNEVAYKITDKVETKAMLDIDYRYNKFSLDELKHFKDYLKNDGLHIFRYYTYRNKEKNNEITRSYNKEKEFKIEDVPSKLQMLKVSPKLEANLKLLENKLTITPQTSIDLMFENDSLTSLIKYKKTVLNLGLNVKYNW